MAAGARVSAMAPYSDGAPVTAVCRKWFSPGNSTTAARAFYPRAARMRGPWVAGGVCRSRPAKITRTGQVRRDSAAVGS